MPFPLRMFTKQIVSEIALTESRSYPIVALPNGNAQASEDFNLQFAQFLQVAGGTPPGDNVRVAPGATLYWSVIHTTVGNTATVQILGRTSPTGSFFTIGALTVAGIVDNVMSTSRVDVLGALWEVRVRVVNNGPAAMNGEFAVGLRVR